MRKFTKAERLCGQLWIEHLFQKGYSFSVFPLKLIITPHPKPDAVHQVLITANKRHFKRAVDRNLIKRRIREGYRLQKHLIASSRSYQVAFIYIAKEILSSEIIHEKMKEAMIKLPTHEARIMKKCANLDEVQPKSSTL